MLDNGAVVLHVKKMNNKNEIAGLATYIQISVVAMGLWFSSSHKT